MSAQVHGLLALEHGPPGPRTRRLRGRQDSTGCCRFRQELPAIFAQVHGLLAEHSRMWGSVLPEQEALLCDILSEVGNSGIALLKRCDGWWGRVLPAQEALLCDIPSEVCVPPYLNRF